ncbi:uncharacterized protein LOC118515173 [Anopheles stephensi]|uniref:uncharacterized protein LOC118515173 n=1 Tax=Anopheles stephensi TaxID=30069 RepID=UPI0016589A31|nr:uncharacterized protein LOC118515173 [Anopheles stephensi]
MEQPAVSETINGGTYAKHKNPERMLQSVERLTQELVSQLEERHVRTNPEECSSIVTGVQFKIGEKVTTTTTMTAVVTATATATTTTTVATSRVIKPVRVVSNPGSPRTRKLQRESSINKEADESKVKPIKSQDVEKL